MVVVEVVVVVVVGVDGGGGGGSGKHGGGGGRGGGGVGGGIWDDMSCDLQDRGARSFGELPAEEHSLKRGRFGEMDCCGVNESPSFVTHPRCGPCATKGPPGGDDEKWVGNFRVPIPRMSMKCPYQTSTPTILPSL